MDRIDLRVCEMANVTRMFEGMAKGEYDVSEFSFAELVYSISRGKGELIGIPIFPLRKFRHGYIFCNSASGITDPQALVGKRIGLHRLAQTACVWIRGTLTEEYRLPPKKTSWYVPCIHNWDQGEEDEIQSRDGEEEGPSSREIHGAMD